MAAFRTQEASSSSSMSRFSYHVFLSFRGTDTRKNFTDHLYTYLLSAGIRTFRDDDELQRGENIEKQLPEAIEGSMIYMVVFSEDYASSRWCLDELVKIIDCKKNYGRVVLPIFYHVDQTQVGEQKGSYGESFARHEEKYKLETDKRRKEWMERVQRWREALSEVANMEEGMVLPNQSDVYESKFIQEIIKETAKKLNRTIFRVTTHPIGIDTRVESIDSWLRDGSDSIGLLAIYGIGGIGKTTIAKTVYNLHFDKFDSSSFLANIREASAQPNGLARLQRQLLSDILKKRTRKIYNVDEGVTKIKEAVSYKRILLVLDDVDDLDQLEFILGIRESFYPGSKIIITTRHERLLKGHDLCEMYKVKPLDDKESLRLFSWYAFRTDSPDETFAELSRNVVNHCEGIPLALQVLGSSLSGRNKDVWESALKKLEVIPDSQILKKLRISYDNLLDDHDQTIFLDIACFFIGKERDYVVTILDYDLYPIVGIQNLVDRCLLTIDNKNKLRMHQLLQDMGREVIRQESPWQPERRSRIWRHKDSFSILKEKTGTEKTIGFVLDMQMVKEGKTVGKMIGTIPTKRRLSRVTHEEIVLANQGYSAKRRRINIFKHLIKGNSEISYDVNFDIDAVARMKNLRLLQLSHVQLTGYRENFPRRLRWLYWRGFRSKSIPDDFPLESLVALDMRNSSLEQVWRGSKFLGLLKILNLSHSHSLRRTPDFSDLPNLKILILKYCISLIQVHESIGDLEKLVVLNLKGCKNLRHLPGEMGNLKSLEKLIISGCSKLKLPIEMSKLESLTELHADDIDLNESTSADNEAKSWPALVFSWVSKQRKSQNSINFSLGSLSHTLRSLSFANCNLSDNAISIDLSSLPLLWYLNLSGNLISTLPQSIKNHPMLRDLWLDSCPRLKSLPELPSSLIDLKTVDCPSLEKITNLPNLLKTLFLDVRGCENLSEVQGLFILEPIGSFDLEMIKSLGILNLETIGNFQVELFNKLTDTRKTAPVQGLYEFGIFSTCIPGHEVPNEYDVIDLANLVSFIVPSDTKIQGLNICVVYSRSRDKIFNYWGRKEYRSWFSYYVKVHNKTKGLKWVYQPTFIGIPGSKEDIAFLCHWKFGDHGLEAGDEMCLSVVALSPTFRVKKFGCSLVYEKLEEEATSIGQVSQEVQETSTIYSHAYEFETNEFFLSHADYSANAQRSTNKGTHAVLYKHLFEDHSNTIDCTNGGGGEEEREGDSDYDYPDFNESDSDFDQEVIDEVEELLAAPNWWD